MAKRKKKIKKSGLLLILLIFVIGIYFVFNYGIKYFETNGNPTASTSGNKNPNKEPEEEKEKTYKLSLLATGDGLIHSVIYKAYEVPNGTYDFTPALKYIKPIVSKYDIAYYNQETPLGDDSLKYGGYPRFYTPQEFGDAMLDAGFNTISLATNHSFDRGEKGVLNTLNYFKDKDILYNGESESFEAQQNYIIKEKNNITYTMLSYTTLDNGLPTPQSKKYLVSKYDKELVKKDIEALRDKVDVLIVAMHWGVEYTHEPPAEEKEIAAYLASLGVDIVIGNHSHVLQPITKIDDTIVFYSLGNFISNQYGTNDYNKLVGFLGTLDITKTVTPEGEKKVVIDNLGGELIFTYYVGNPVTTAYHTGHTVIPFSMMKDETYLKDYKRIYEKYTKILKNMGQDLNIAPLPN